MLIQKLFDFDHGTCGHQRLADLLLRETTEHVHVRDLGPCYMYILDYTEDPHELRSLRCKNKTNQINSKLSIKLALCSASRLIE